MSRREQIEKMLAADPQDTFLRYSLAMEYQKDGHADQALAIFAELMDAEPTYVPACFMSAKLLVGLHRVDEARSALRTGIEAARGQGDSHAAAEMSELLTTLGALGE
jgi:thioredoxin-like negative regulator of GroEL